MTAYTILLSLQNIENNHKQVSAAVSTPRPGIIFKKRKRFTLPWLKWAVFTLKHFLLLIVPFILISAKVCAQTPTISYTPSTNTYIVGTTIAPLIPTTGGGAADSYSSEPLPSGLSFDTTT